MANISHFTQTVNGVSTTYDIRDANAVPRSGGAVMTGNAFYRTVNDNYLAFSSGTDWQSGGGIALYGPDVTWTTPGMVQFLASLSSDNNRIMNLRNSLS